MPKNKLRKDFMVAVQGEQDWYRAYTEDKAHDLAAAGAEVYFLPGAFGKMDFNIRAFSNYALLRQAMAQSESIKRDYAKLLTEHMVGDAEGVEQLYQKVRELEAEIRRNSLSHDYEDALFEKHGEAYEYFIEDMTLEALRDLTENAYSYERALFSYSIDVPKVYKSAKALELIRCVLTGKENVEGEVADEMINTLVALDADALMPLGDEMGIGYGDREHYNDFADRLEGKRDYGSVYFNVSDAVMKRWDDLNTRITNSGKRQVAHAFVIGEKQNRSQKIYVEGSLVREHGRKLEL